MESFLFPTDDLLTVQSCWQVCGSQSPGPSMRNFRYRDGADSPYHLMLLSFSYSVVSDSLRPHGLQHARLPCPSPTPGACLKLMTIDLVMPSNHLILCHPLLLLPSIFPSIKVFSSESVLPIRWPKYWSFSFSISPSNEHSGLVSFRIDWLDLLAVQETLKSLLLHHSSKASIFQPSAFFMAQFSDPYMTTGKIIALTRWILVAK